MAAHTLFEVKEVEWGLVFSEGNSTCACGHADAPSVLSGLAFNRPHFSTIPNDTHNYRLP